MRRTHAAPRHGRPAHDVTGHKPTGAGADVAPRPGRRAAVLFAAATALAVLSAAVGAGTVVALRPSSADRISEQRLVEAVGAADTHDSVQQVSARVMASVVTLETVSGDSFTQGSGVVLRGDGLIVTNSHVVSAAGQAGQPTNTRASFTDGTTAPFILVGADPVTDIAVVRVHGIAGLTPIRFGSSAALRVGQNVVAVGAPLGLQGTVTAGIISALHRRLNLEGTTHRSASVTDAIQTSAAMNPGSSGGALVDMRGRLVGINTAIASAGDGAAGGRGGSIGINFAIPADQVKGIAERLVADASVAPLGASGDVGVPACGQPR